MPRVQFLKTFVQKAEDLEVSDESPRGVVHEAGRDLAGDPFDVKVGAQAFEDVDDKVKIFIKTGTVEG